MGDICKANKKLLAPGGEDYFLLTANERNTGDISNHTYTDHDRMVLRQYEASALPAKGFSKFTQERGSSYAYLLLEIKITLQSCSCDYFSMNSGECGY